MTQYIGNPLIVSCWNDAKYRPQAHDLASVQVASWSTFIIFPVVILLGLSIFIFPWDSPSQLRSRVYMRIRGKTPRAWNHHVGVAGAMVIYLSSLLSAVICPIAFPLNLAVNEVILSNFPESEGPASIGQFMPWVQVGFAVAGMMFLENYTSWAFARLKEKLTPAAPDHAHEQQGSSSNIIFGFFEDIQFTVYNEWNSFLKWFEDPQKYSSHDMKITQEESEARWNEVKEECSTKQQEKHDM